MKKILCLVGCLAGLVVASSVASASENVSGGKISILTFRSNYVVFKLVDGNGTNKCSSCAVDPSGYSSGVCWVPDSDEALVSMLITTRAMDKENITARVNSWSSCRVYQFTIPD